MTELKSHQRRKGVKRDKETSWKKISPDYNCIIWNQLFHIWTDLPVTW